MYNTYFSHDFCFSNLLFRSLCFLPSVLLSLWFPPSPLLLLHLHLLLPPSEQTAGKSLNIPNIQRNPGLSLSLSLSLSPPLCRSFAEESTCLSPSLSLSLSVTRRNLHVSRSFSPSAWGVNETKFTGNKTIELKHKPKTFWWIPLEF